jgi:carbonic anhydrase
VHVLLEAALVASFAGFPGLDCGSAPAAPPAPEPHASTEVAEHGDAGKAAEPGQRDHGTKHADSARTYGLPFVRDADTEVPEERARGFLRELTRDNGAFVRSHDAKFFKAFADSQKPRATVVACSDSRVQSPAFDATPENDLFTIRNIGNQLTTAEGSVDYGVGHLKTPVLLILGHSGCGAIKAAMGDFSQQPEAVRRELETIDVSSLPGDKPSGASGSAARGPGGDKPLRAEKRAGEKGRAPDTQAWIDAVVANVHHQILGALASFSEQVAARDLIVIGAIYDFRNDMRQGAGKVNVVNVNGHTDPIKISAFLRAIDDRSSGATGPTTTPPPSTASPGAVAKH